MHMINHITVKLDRLKFAEMSCVSLAEAVKIVEDNAMIPNPPLPSVLHNLAGQRFEMQVEDSAAFLSYIREGDRVILDHTFVPDALRGRGIAAALVRAALHEARHLRWKIVPRCSYVAEFIGRNQEFADLVDGQGGKVG